MSELYGNNKVFQVKSNSALQLGFCLKLKDKNSCSQRSFTIPYLGPQIITLSDLECDYINARSCCSKLNKEWNCVIWLAVIGYLLLSIYTDGLIFPLTVLTRFIMVPSGNMGVFDPTEIHNRGQLKSHMKEAMIKLGFHLLCFFMYLYSMILALIND
ncbi:protein cornichon homolog 4 [Leptonychotes weddellii]|uniref:Protein cornichon homolog 4 n=1 Tax=Leptonychotes weddellii TaxID=9713 RepID=A0A7F8PVQ8_LEPWE|nr:protein cornichon homolog 4 [Leptonychotes weddellii]